MNPRARQDERLGNPDPQRSALAQLLQQHGVVVRGGQREALRLLEALEVRGGKRTYGFCTIAKA